MSKTVTYQTAMRYEEDLMDAAIVEVSPVDASEFAYELSHDKATLYEDYLYENAIVEASMPDMNTADDFGLRACDAKAIGTINLMKHSGCFSTINHMALIMEGSRGGGFYAAVFRDRTNKACDIGLVIKYPDGTLTPIIKMCQSDLMCVERVHINRKDLFIKKPKAVEDPPHPFIVQTRKKLKGFMTPDMPIDEIRILQCLYDKYQHLPVIELGSQEISIEEIYRAVAISASRLSLNETSKYIESDDYFRLTTADFQVIAQDMGYMGYTKCTDYKEIIKCLDEYDLIAKLQHTTGRQTKIKCKNEHLNVYLVIKNPKRFEITVKNQGEFPTYKNGKPQNNVSKQ